MNRTNRELRDFYKIPQSTLARLKQKGIDVMNPYAVRDKILLQTRRPEAWVNGCPFTDEQAEAFLAAITKNFESKKKVIIPEPAKDMPEDEAELHALASAATTYDEARFYLTKGKALHQARQNQIQDKEYLPASEVAADFLQIGHGVRAMLSKLQADLPAQLEGLSAAQMKLKIKHATHEVMLAMSDSTSDIYKPQGEAN